MKDDMAFAEGCYRLESREWEVFTIRRSRHGIEPPGVKKNLRWNSGVTGLSVVVPDESKINKSTVLEAMSEALGIADWVEVRGPDSMALR
jgi:hypothetical protein